MYNMLTAAGLKVWWDKLCLKAGENWKEGFCAGLVSSRTFVCLLSRGAINHPTNERQSFATLKEDSAGDNVLLEHRLALELVDRRLVELVAPILVGDELPGSSGGEGSSGDALRGAVHGDYFRGGCAPSSVPAVVVASVEAELGEQLDRAGLGSALAPDVPAAATWARVLGFQAAGFIEGPRRAAIEVIVARLVRELPLQQQKSVAALADTDATGVGLRAELERVRSDNAGLSAALSLAATELRELREQLSLAGAT
jgi:hypothetical protein